MNNTIKASGMCTAIVITQFLTGCAAIAEKTNMLTDEKIVNEAAGVLGYAPSQL